MKREELIDAMRQTAAQAPRAVDVPKWGRVYVRDITVAEIEAQTRDTADGEDTQRLARAAARVLCDESGNLLFNADDADDVALIARQPWRILQAVLAATDTGN